MAKSGKDGFVQIGEAFTGKPENTPEKQVASWFKPGQSGNPSGRPKGSRNKLGEEFITHNSG